MDFCERCKFFKPIMEKDHPGETGDCKFNPPLVYPVIEMRKPVIGGRPIPQIIMQLTYYPIVYRKNFCAHFEEILEWSKDRR